MARSGSVGDVLKVSQELSQIRNEIEQIQGQVQHLRQQVAYSRINLTLEEAIAQTQQGVSVGDRLQETWSQSTHALGKTTTNVLRLGIWLLVFSPYLLAGLIYSSEKNENRENVMV
jgi:type III secretory pathway lipoprotein EscJ